MEKLYYSEPYLRQVRCRVTSVEGNNVTVDRTIFYPEGGGQDGDRGTLGPCKVLDTKKAPDGDSLLVVDKPELLKVGDELDLVLDWDHRYRCMVTHTCQHMLSGLLYTMFGIGTVAVHMAEDYLTIETDRTSIDEETIRALVKRANEEVTAARKVHGVEMSHAEAEALGLRRSIKVEGDVRIVIIDDVDRIACGGVHVASTSELKLVVYTGHEQIRGHVRLFFTCGDAAVSNAITNGRTVKTLCSTLSCSEQELETKIQNLTAEVSALKASASAMAGELALSRLQKRLSPEGVAAFIASEGEDLGAYGRCAENFEDLALCAVQNKGGRNLWLIALKGRYDMDFNVFRKGLLEQFGAKGGGKSPLFQGMAETGGQAFLDRFVQILGEAGR